jgi:hypothetical protein
MYIFFLSGEPGYFLFGVIRNNADHMANTTMV